MKRGVYAGSFDPITLGHIDIVRRAVHMVDSLWVAVGVNPKKHGLFDPEEKVALIRGALDCQLERHERRRIDVAFFNGLLVDYAQRLSARYIFRGLRAAADFNAEFEMHGINHDLAPDIETVFLMAPPAFLHISSSTIKEIASFRNAHLNRFVTPNVERALMRKLHPQDDDFTCARA